MADGLEQDLDHQKIVTSLKEEFSNAKEKQILLKGLKEDTIEIFKKHNAVIAGGAITSIFSAREIKDYDIFFKDQNAFDNTLSHFSSRSKTYTKTYESNASVTFSQGRNTIQLIKLPQTFQPTAEKLVNTFDFTICMGAYDFEAEKFFFHHDFLKHIAQRKLIYNLNCIRPVSAVVRIKKFEQKEYSISKAELLKVIFSVQQLQINSYDEVLEHLTGVSARAYFDLKESFEKKKLFETPFDFNIFIQMIEEYETKAFTNVEPTEACDLPF